MSESMTPHQTIPDDLIASTQQSEVQEPGTQQPGLQPLLHDLITCLAAPTVALSAADGQIRQVGAQGVFAADLRVLSLATIRVNGQEGEAVGNSEQGAAVAEFICVIRDRSDTTPDPQLWLRRFRTVTTSGMRESLTVENVGTQARSLTIELELGSDLADIEQVKSGLATKPAVAVTRPGGLGFGTAQVRVLIQSPGADITLASPHSYFRWDVHVPARSTVTREWSLLVEDFAPAVTKAPAEQPFSAPEVRTGDRRLAPLVDRAVNDLLALRLSATGTPDQTFLGAGSPWYLTLFGRDSIWAARMLLPLGTDLALGTLRTLAAFQGKRVDLETAEEPGKIPHEVRRPQSDLDEAFLPPVYYGTIDATPLWVCLLHDAWRWGASTADIEALLPAAEAALNWMRDYGDSDGDGFLEYIDHSGRGLTNQGWKDSGDSVRFADGRIADGPVALAEVQAYAYQAAMAGAALFDAFDRPGGQEWRTYAACLKALFQQKFWNTDVLGRYPVLALDGAKCAVDAVASNMGHLLGTGILDPEDSRIVADRLVHPTMSSGFGLRTMSTDADGYSPLSYHCGSVWPHDTAIAIGGLADEGLHEHAAVLAEGLLAAGAAFQGRLPELYGGFDSGEMPSPVPYPASCRPQAWSAAAAIVLLRSRLRLGADAPGGQIVAGSCEDPLEVEGLRIGIETFGLGARPNGVSLTGELPPGVRLVHLPTLTDQTTAVDGPDHRG